MKVSRKQIILLPSLETQTWIRLLKSTTNLKNHQKLLDLPPWLPNKLKIASMIYQQIDQDHRQSLILMKLKNSQIFWLCLIISPLGRKKSTANPQKWWNRLISKTFRQRGMFGRVSETGIWIQNRTTLPHSSPKVHPKMRRLEIWSQKKRCRKRLEIVSLKYSLGVNRTSTKFRFVSTRFSSRITTKFLRSSLSFVEVKWRT